MGRSQLPPEVVSGHISVDNEDILIFAVKNGLYEFGVCRTGTLKGVDHFCIYMHDEPIITYTVQSGNEYSDMVAVGYEPPHKQTTIDKQLDEVYKEVCSGAALEYALMPLMKYLSDGLYAVRVVKTYPTSGGGMFFWSGSTIPRHLRHSGRYINLIPKEKSYSAPYILPTMASSLYNTKTVNDALIHARRGDDLVGISYHISGFYSVLLKGHFAAAAAAANDQQFTCVQIQPIKDVWKVPDEEGVMHAVGFSSASFKVPFSALNGEQLRTVLAARDYRHPENYPMIKTKIEAFSKKAITVKELPHFLNYRCEVYPDADMIASAQGISELTRPMLESLASGLTSYNGNVIINESLYASITAACNYLRCRSMDEFFEFATDVIKNPDLAATYSFIVQCMSKLHEERVKSLFTELLASNDPVYVNVVPMMRRYIERYDKPEEQAQAAANEGKGNNTAARRSSNDFGLPSLTKRSQLSAGRDGASLIASHVNSMMGAS